jgi:hypothetical protein
MVAALTASAIAPIAGASLGAGPEFAAALGQLGNIGGNYLADLLAGTAQRLRTQDLDDWRDAITTDLAAALEAGDLGLRDESATLLHAIGAVDAALRREALAYAFAALGDDVSRLHILAVDAAASLTVLPTELAAQGRALAAQTGLLRQSLALLARLQLEVRPPHPARPAPHRVRPRGAGPARSSSSASVAGSVSP